MDTLHITLFGQVSVIHPNQSTPVKISRGVLSFLAYLLLQQHLVPREVLMDVFWADDPPDRARSSLTTAIWRLRQLLEPSGVQPGTYLIAHNTGDVGFNWESGHWLDTESFEQCTHPFLRKPTTAVDDDNIRQLEEVLALYRGELLQGIYADWALRERERFRSLYLTCLAHLMDVHAHRESFEQSIAYGQAILRQDPLREEIHRDLMRIYLQCGQRGLAVRQYMQCHEILNLELGVPPLEETEALYREIVGVGPTGGMAGGQECAPELTQLLHEFQLVKRSLDETTHTLARIAQSVNRLLGDAATGSAGKLGR